MLDSQHVTDTEYERARRDREQQFLADYVAWAKAANKQAKRLIPPSVTATELLKQVATEVFGGEQAAPQSLPRRFYGYKLVDRMAEMSKDFVASDLESYFRLLARKRIPPSKTVPLLRNHWENFLDLTRKNKWGQYVIRRVQINYIDPEWIDDCWQNVVRSTEERLNQLEDEIFLGDTFNANCPSNDPIHVVVTNPASAIPAPGPMSQINEARCVPNGDANQNSPAADNAKEDPAIWDAIEISFTSDHRVQIHNGKNDGIGGGVFNYSDLGFEDRRTGNPNRAWRTLKLLAQNRGVIRDGAATGEEWTKVEKRIQGIRKVLRKHFGASTDPLQFIEGTGYQALFRINCRPSFDT